MFTVDKQDKFVELRAQGWSFAHIASELHLSKRTLVDWSREFAADIDSLRTAGVELLHEKVTASREEDLNRLLRFQKDVEDELANRSLSCVPFDKLFQIASELRKQVSQMLAEREASEQPATPARYAANPSDDDAGTANCRPRSRTPRSAHRTNGEVNGFISQPVASQDGEPSLNGPPHIVLRPLSSPHCLPQGVSAEKESAEDKVRRTMCLLHSEPDDDGTSTNGSSQPATPATTPIESTEEPASVPESIRCAPSPALPPSTTAPSPEVTTANSAPPSSQNPQEFCLGCGAELPALLPNGQQPSHYCQCGQSLSLPGLNLRERCSQCGFLLPPHGYNADRPSDTCPACAANLPPLDPKAPACWIPKHMRTTLPPAAKP